MKFTGEAGDLSEQIIHLKSGKKFIYISLDIIYVMLLIILCHLLMTHQL